MRQDTAEFRAANDLAPHPITLKAQAECLERLGRMREALPFFEQYLAQMPNAPDAADIRARMMTFASRAGSSPAMLACFTTFPMALRSRKPIKYSS